MSAYQPGDHKHFFFEDAFLVQGFTGRKMVFHLTAKDKSFAGAEILFCVISKRAQNKEFRVGSKLLFTA